MNRFAQQYRNRVPYLAHGFAPGAFNDKAVREGLNSFRFTYRKIAHAAIWIWRIIFWLRHNLKFSLRRNKPLRGVLSPTARGLWCVF